MDADQQSNEFAAAIGQAVAAAVGARLAQLERQLGRVESRVDSFVPRRPITDSVKARHRAVLRELGGRCPCCGKRDVVDGRGGVTQGAEWDHFYSRERREFADVWLLCKACHREMQARHDRTIEFLAYQRRAVAFEAGQLVLFPLNSNGADRIV